MREFSIEKNFIDEGFKMIFDHPDEWDLVTLDSTTLDNTAHTSCSNCKQNDDAMKQTEEIISHLIQNMSDDTSLVIVSDHGRDDTRDHGGNSLGELHTIFAMYQKDIKFKIDPMEKSILHQGKLRVVPFISLASTISNILQTYVPFSNVGVLRPEYLIYENNSSDFEIYKDIFKSVLLNELQITTYIQHYISVADKDSQKSVIQLMQSFLDEISNNKEKMVEILKRIKGKSQDNSQNEKLEIISMIKDYQTTNFSDKVNSFNSKLNELWSMPNTKNTWYLIAIALLFLTLQPAVTCIIKYCDVNIVPNDRKFIKLQTFYIKIRFVALGLQFFYSDAIKKPLCSCYTY